MVEAATPSNPDPDTSNPSAGEAPKSGEEPKAGEEAPKSGEEPKGGDDKPLAGGGGESDDKSKVVGDWPDDWRTKLAGDDEKLAKHLGRLSSPKDLINSYQDLRRRLNDAKIVDELPEDATEDQIKEWREKNGVPQEPKGYLENLPDGLVFGENDEKALEGFVERMHANNVDPATVNEALAWYKDYQEEVETAQVEADRGFRKDAEETLREEWGNEYRANVNAITNFLSSASEDLSNNLLGARLADGTLLGDNPEALKWLHSLANTMNPAGFVSPSGGGDQLTSVKEELDQIRELRRTDPDKYYKDEKVQERFRQLLDAEERLSA